MSGGIIAVAYTDVAQFGLMVFGMLVLFPIAVIKSGDFSEINIEIKIKNTL